MGDTAIKETISSLQAYFIAGAILISFGTFAALATSNISLIGALINFAFCAGYFYIGISLRRLIVDSPQLINNFIFASMAYQIIDFLLELVGGSQTYAIIDLALGLLINWYLLNTVKRLAP